MITISFDTWDEFDNAIGSIATAFVEASKEGINNESDLD